MSRSALWSSCDVVMRSTIASLAIVSLCACARKPEPAADATRADQTVTLGQTFKLERGKTAAIPDRDLRIQFEAVSEDSRCPTGVQCVWAGDARVVLRLARARGDATIDTVGLNVEPRTVTYAGYVIRLVGLEPPSRQNAPPRPDDYVASLVVTEAASSR